MIAAIRLQRAGIGFVEVKAVHRDGNTHVTEFVAKQEDCDKFKAWAATEGVTFDLVRVATPEEIQALDEVAW